jgi:uncharacterized protein
VSLYLDASLLVALFVIDPTSARADAFLSEQATVVVISDFGAAEFSSAVARRVRMRDLTRDEGRLAFAQFDTWIARSVRRRELTTADIASAERILRRLDVNLRAPDALHVAIAERIGATLVTFDQRMAANARALGMAVAMP